MAGLDETRPFMARGIAVLTISDSRTAQDDRSGSVLAHKLQAAGHRLVGRDLVRDDQGAIVQALTAFLREPQVDVVLTTGGTGVTGRDVTPEAVRSLIDREIPGFGELFRMLSYAQIGTSCMLSRALAGVARGKYIFALPGSPSACRDAWDWILNSQLDNRQRPCNLSELLGRLTEK